MQHILRQDLAIGKVTSEHSGNLFYFQVAPYGLLKSETNANFDLKTKLPMDILEKNETH